jgi:hypothetical protein
MSAVGHWRARNVRFSVLIVNDAAALILSDAQQAGTITADGDGVIVTMSSVPELIPWPGFAR